MRTKDKLTYQSLQIFKIFLSKIGAKKRFWIAKILSNFIYYLIPVRKKVANKNLKIAFPSLPDKELNKIVQKTYKFFVHNLIEFCAFPAPMNEIKIEIKGKEYIEAALKQKNGLILVSGHFGSWEILGNWIGKTFPIFTGVAIKQKNHGAHKFFIEQRELSGTRHIFKKESINKMYKVLSHNGILGLVSDQDARKSGVFVSFFGKKASTSKGAALFHINKKSPLIVALCNQNDYKNYVIKFIPVNTLKKGVQEITQAYTRILEENIIKNPDQYFWFHRRWKTKYV
jgi:KDO2-lipid IV(A) lauroyltransferase